MCQYLGVVMLSKSRREEIRKFYRSRRVDVGKTQVDVASAARMDLYRFFRIENGRAFPKDDEPARLARVLKCDPSDLPSAQARPQESMAS